MDKFKKAVEQINEHGCEMVDFKIIDAAGRLHHVTIPTSNITPEKLEFGFGFDGSNFGFADTKKSDFIARPVICDEINIDPCFIEPTATFMCDVYQAAETIYPYPSDPRGILRKANNLMISMDVAQEAFWGPEIEFHLFSDIKLRTDAHAMMAEIVSEEGYWGSDDWSSANRIQRKGGYHVCPPYDTFYNARAEAVKRLIGLGYNIKYHHHEVGGPGQCEIEFNLMPTMQAANSIILGKYVIRNVASEYGAVASFLPKPILAEAGNGLHVHHLLKKSNGEFVFYDPQGYMGLSKIAMSFLAGLLLHAPALTAITNPSTNSYKRLVRGYEAPCNVCYGMANRNAAVRIPAYATKENEKRFEYRVMDATVNPYLGIAAILMAGLDGVRKNLDPQGKYGPLEKMPELMEKPQALIPATLKEALDELRRDNAFLTENGVFTKEFLENFIATKMMEHLRVEQTPHPIEFEMYDWI